ncbi:HAD family hydrolase [Rhodobacter calidifons]|uniref:HAD family phosphatase n=1 Tax=Rhodobacter calidifons TaxID=2715277 RepID=A0ABX0G5X0_9RHOB|nr:HAD family phosphatase [Rhodobacter calidifons]NHB76372.1 HAD family phosphatase [Rhodobacter calidifons]
MTRPQAVLFDCDGVVVDSEGMTFDLFLKDLAAHGLPLTPEAFEADFVGGTVEMVARRARAAGADLPEDWVARFYDRMYAMMAAGVPLIPGVVALLDRLEAAGVPCAVGSNGSMRKMRITLGQHGLTGRFRAVLSGQEIGAPKPAPDVYLRAAAACGADPKACVVIEDSASGAQAGLAAGMRVLGYAGHGPDTVTARQLTALGVPLFHRMADLPDLLGL